MLFVVEGNLTLTIDEQTHALRAGSYVYLPAGASWTLRVDESAQGPGRLHWIRKTYQHVEGLDMPEALVTHETEVEGAPMPGTQGRWTTQRFVGMDDLRHDMHCTIVNFETGGVIPFPETHVMEHGLYVLEGKAVYLLNTD